MMKHLFLSTIVAPILLGCAVPVIQYKVIRPAVAAQTQPVVVPGPEVIEYPQVESAYIWDPALSLFFFEYRGRKHYMDKGWEYRRGVPHDYYRK